MKKILFVSTDNINNVGGSLKYTKELINIFKNDFEIDSIYSKKNNKRKRGIFSLINIFLFKYKIHRKCKKYKPDYVIVCSSPISILKKTNKKFNVFSIQHTEQSVILGSPLKRILKKILMIKPSFFVVSNIICFNKSCVEFFKKHINKNANYYDICLYNKEFHKRKKIDNSLPITYIGRISPEKNVELIDKVSSKLDRKIQIVSEYKKQDSSIYKNLIFLGYKDNKEITQIILNSKAVIILSKFEGLPFALIESLSCSTPIITTNSYSNSLFMINNNKNGLLVNKEDSDEVIAKKINEFDFSKLDVDQIYEFARDNFSYEKFVQKWKSIIK